MAKKPEGLTILTFVVLGITIFVLLWIVLIPVKRGGRTQSIIIMLDMACQSYQKEFYVFPPTEKYPDSRALHFHLGSNRRPAIIHYRTPPSTPKPPQNRPPLVAFIPSMLELSDGRTDVTPNPPVQIIDSWGNPIRYRNPGIHNEDGVDIWSAGPNGKFEADSGETNNDDITNWAWKEDK